MTDFVILHYQSLEETDGCVRNVLERLPNHGRIFVVDNGSPNGSGEALEELYRDNPDVKIILTGENLGFARGNNVGFREARKDSPDFIVVMNNDVMIEQTDFLERIEASYGKNRFAILGPDVFSTKTRQHQNPQRMENYTLRELERAEKKLAFKDSHRWLLRIKYILPRRKTPVRDAPFVNETLENVVLHGACYVFSKDFIRAHENCFYDKTFMYYESYILHYLAGAEGLKMVYDPSVKVIHHEDVSTNQTYGTMYRKAVFVNRCLLDSCRVFLSVMQGGRDSV